MKGYGEIFEGDPECYWSWKDFISSQLDQIHATPEDSILILKANTKGRPQQTIKNAMIAGMGNPSDTLRDILARARRGVWFGFKNFHSLV